MKRRLINLIIAVTMLVSLMPIIAKAETVTYGDLSFDTSTGTITGCNTSISGDLVIPSTIDGVSVIAIDEVAFMGCENLTSIELPDGLKSIGGCAFQDCKKLESIEIPNGVISIGDCAFRGCFSLTSIDIPNSVTNIVFGPFAECVNLTNINVDTENENYCSVDGVLFDKEKKTLIQYPAGRGKAIYSIPSSVTKIGEYAFSGCEKLMVIHIPDGVTNIGSYAFFYCIDMMNIEIPSKLTSIGQGTFAGCTSLTSIEIPDGVTDIGTLAFNYCDSVTDVIMPNSVKSIGGSAFDDCESLTDVYYGGSAAEWNAISVSYGNDDLLNSIIHYDGMLSTPEPTPEPTKPPITETSGVCGDNLTWILDDNGTLTISGTGNMADYESMAAPWYSHASSINLIIIEDGVKIIGECAFYGLDNVELISIPLTVVEIKDMAFARCKSLTNINIPSSVESIGNYVFQNCLEIKEINVDNENKNYCSVDGNLFNIDKTELIKYAVGKDDIEYIIPNGVTSIGEQAFADSYSLTNVIIPEGVTTIAYAAFFNCYSLESVSVGNGLNSICEYAFRNCLALKSVKIPKSVKSIDSYAFSRCNSLLDVYYAGTEEEWNDINIGSDNTYLVDATIHYNSVLSTPEPTTPPIDYENNKILASVDENKVQITLDLSDGTDENDVILFVAMKKNNELIQVIMLQHENMSSSFETTEEMQDSVIEIYAWNRNNEPYAEKIVL